MNPTPTPLTDQQSIRAETAFRAGAEEVVTSDFARALERRNAELREAAESALGHFWGRDWITDDEAGRVAVIVDANKMKKLMQALAAQEGGEG